MARWFAEPSQIVHMKLAGGHCIGNISLAGEGKSALAFTAAKALGLTATVRFQWGVATGTEGRARRELLMAAVAVAGGVAGHI
jgi:hypothetical protein